MKKKSLLYVAVFLISILAATAVFTAADASERNVEAAGVTYTVNSREDWLALSEVINGTLYEDFAGDAIELNCDLDASGLTFFSVFAGTFNGNGHKIYNLTEPFVKKEISVEEYDGITYTGVVSHLEFVKPKITRKSSVVAVTNSGVVSNVKITGGEIESNTAGTVVSKNYGTVENCTSTAGINSCYNGAGSVSVGGLVYQNFGSINNSEYVGNIAVTSQCYEAGGIAAINTGRISACQSSADITVKKAKNSDGSDSARADVYRIGGLVGTNGSAESVGTVTHSFFNGSFYSDEVYFTAAGLIGTSRNTAMSYCYSAAEALHGNLYGILHQIYPQYVYETVEGQSVPVSVSGSLGNNGVEYCYALTKETDTLSLYPESMNYNLYAGETGEGAVFDVNMVVSTPISLTLPASNVKYSHTVFLNNGELKLTDLLNADPLLEQPLWVGGAGQFPLNDGIFDGEGSQADPFLIKSVLDVLLLRSFFFGDTLAEQTIEGATVRVKANYYFKQTEDIDFEGISYDFGCRLRSFAGYYEGKGLAVYNFNNTYLFENSYGEIRGLGFFADKVQSIVENSDGGVVENCYTDGQNYGSTLVDGQISGGAANVSAFTFGYLSQPLTSVTPALGFSSGSGTSADPYIVTTREEFALLGSLYDYNYAALGNTVIFNSYDEVEKYGINIFTFSGHLDGRGHSVVGILQGVIFGEIFDTASVKNLVLRGIIKNGDGTALLCGTNSGTLENITTVGSVSGNAVAPLAYTNNGSVTRAINHAGVYANSAGMVVYENAGTVSLTESDGVASLTGNVGGIAYENTGNGSITDCFAFGASDDVVETGSLDGVYSSVSCTGSEVKLWNGELSFVGAELIFSDVVGEIDDFDWTVWGYEVGKPNYPSLRRKNAVYKLDVSGYFKPYALTEKVYDRIAIDKDEIENAVVSDAELRSLTVFDWTKDGESLTSSYIVDAGVYVLTAAFVGTDDKFPFEFVFTFTVNKAEFADNLQFSASGLVLSKSYATVTSFAYNGAEYDITALVLSSSIGETVNYSYALSVEGEAVTIVKDAGVYKADVTISNRNYIEKTFVYYFAIAKKKLTVTVANAETPYKSAPPQFTISSVEGLVENDTAAVIEGGEYVCGYTVGDNVGTYNVGYAVEPTNYSLTVINGILNVTPIDIPNEWYSLSNVIMNYRGIPLSLKATLYQDMTVTYANNGQVNVGEYTVSVTFSKANYKTLTKTAKLTIKAVDLVITAKSYTVSFGESPPSYTYEPIAFLGGDTISSLSAVPKFSCAYLVGTVMGEYDISCVNEASVTSPNYRVSFVTGKLTVIGAEMYDLFEYPDKAVVYCGESVNNEINTGDYAVSVAYEYFYGGIKLPGAPVNTGVYTVKATVTPNNENYLMRNYVKTVFTASITIRKANLTLSFNPSYEYPYNAEPRTVPYNGTLPSDGNWATVSQTATKADNVTVSIFKDAGVYNVLMKFTGSGNYNDYEMTTVLTITPLDVVAEITEDKIYSAQYLTPDYTFSGKYPDDVIASQISYRWANNSLTSRVKNAGTYTCIITSQNKNYVVKNTPSFTIKPRTVSLVPDYVEFSYGDDGDFTYVGRPYRAGSDYVVHKNIEIAETGDVTDVTYYLSSKYAGLQNIVGVIDTANYDFDVTSINGEGKVRINRRELSYAWDIPATSVEYNGEEQKIANITISNTAYGDLLSYSLVYNGDVKDVGEYSVWVDLVNTDNYYLNAGTRIIRVTPSALVITLNNAKVEVGKTPIYSYKVTGLQGSDTLSSLGIVIRYVCDYSISSSEAGNVYPITVSPVSNKNYNVAVIAGYLTVVGSGNPTLSMSSKVFTYDGTAKFLSINETMPANTSVSYTNNGKINAGVYTVNAYVLFPNQDSQEISATLTINKARAEIISADAVIPYSVSASIKPENLSFTATLGGVPVEGTAAWSGNTELRRGVNEYSAIFTPRDTANLLATPFLVQITGKVVDLEAFSITGEYAVGGDVLTYYSDNISVELSGVYEGVKLSVNGSEVGKYDISQPGLYLLELKYEGRLIYSKEFNVKNGNLEDEEPKNQEIAELIELNDNLFDFVDIEKGSEGNLLVSGDAIIRLKGDYEGRGLKLYKNGVLVQVVTVSPSEKNVRIEVKKDNITVYIKSFSVEKEEDSAPSEEGGGEVKDDLLWLKILGGVLGGVVVITAVVALLFIRAKNKKNVLPKGK